MDASRHNHTIFIISVEFFSLCTLTEEHAAMLYEHTQCQSFEPFFFCRNKNSTVQTLFIPDIIRSQLVLPPYIA